MDLDLDAVRMGRTGLSVSELAFGTWRFGRETAAGNLETDRETAFDLLDTYASAGGRFIDTADVDGGGKSERWIGSWLQDRDREEGLTADSTASDTEGWEDRYLTPTNVDALDVVRSVAEEVGATPAQVALAYHRHHPDITAPILGARTTDQLEENLRTATVSLSTDQADRLEAAKEGPFDNLV
ncbi:MAG: aldo/keto reductase [Halovenus sp.]